MAWPNRISLLSSEKGWFGVGRDEDWGTGSKHFLRELFEKNVASITIFLMMFWSLSSMKLYVLIAVPPMIITADLTARFPF